MNQTIPFPEAIKMMEALGVKGQTTDHITYDHDLREGDFKVIRGSNHDGTLLFTYQNIAAVLEAVVCQQCLHKRDEGKAYSRIEYTVGPLTVEATYHDRLICDGQFPGQKETVSMPVIARPIP